MFVNSGKLKKIMKEAWRTSGLYVGRDGDLVSIRGPYWQIDVHKALLKKADLAAVVELAGELPQPGSAVTARKGMENEETGYVASMLQALFSKEKMTRFFITRASYRCGSAARVLQQPTTKKCVLLNEDILELVDKYCIDKNREGYPEGPLSPDEKGSAVAWTNGMMKLYAYTVIPAEQYEYEVKEFLELAANIELETVEG